MSAKMGYYRNPIEPGTLLELKKKHPCGSRIWEVVRVGVLIRVRCRVCGRCLDMEPLALRSAVLGEAEK
ncbi:DUF951 domain-containing protein [Aminiphilus circumscriptus]|jgi:hypothetical protein|uniref:DUF951 domain-containing protein n=1 Tax=Aminiphilus circumscriptus TaxID=290732 RepID=UPI003B8450B8